jgi:hypothetical protein
MFGQLSGVFGRTRSVNAWVRLFRVPIECLGQMETLRDLEPERMYTGADSENLCA